MAADVSSVARLLRGEAGKRGSAATEVVTMDLLGGCGGDAGGGGGSRSGGEDEVVDLEVKVPAGWERRLDLMSGKTFLTPRLQGVQVGHQDLNLPPPATAAAATSTSAAVCTLDMVRSALERATAGREAAAGAAGTSPATSSSSSASTSSSSSSVGKRHRSPPAGTATPASPSMRAAACPSCLTYVLIAEADPRCPRCAGNVPPLAGKSRDAGAAAGDGSGKKPKIDLNAAADDTE
ncbi:hypothetical protein E2562_016864 [Oryza meyeriana var. granulata]|uniref:GIR1-like zinc ribbon domain-containing protein n=1 Tax=Oryza meyeriana var. granulata TaxID=110450 RepID=A0A6G1BXZ2_9ORYZ|nr:hypothetical protein E2562_016864 [Oryza meyeriana var. granulata]